ncbi:hypothetical protein GCM10009102_30230 [Sphingomonas insulae]|uniref:Uncharacterized protein n=1 Tax=Sphingomonas insulae TaxID=424800 RepID=A0ABN1HZR0_9SPHN
MAVFLPCTGGRPGGEARDRVTAFLDENGKALGCPVGPVDRPKGLLSTLSVKITTRVAKDTKTCAAWNATSRRA